MIAAVRNELGLVAVHRTFLDPTNILRRPFHKPKLALGLLGSGSVRFGEPDDVLGIAEGIEDALSAIDRSEEHTSELQSLMRISYAVFCLKKKQNRRSEKETTQL